MTILILQRTLPVAYVESRIMAALSLEKRVGNKLQFLRCTMRVTRRRLCDVANKEKQEAHQTGIPLIVPPHVVAKEFIVHPSTTIFISWITNQRMSYGRSKESLYLSKVSNFLQ